MQLSRILTASLVFALTFVLQSPLLATASQHVVPPAELQQATTSAANSRQQNIDKVQKFFSSQQAEAALKSAHLDPTQVKTAVPSLSNQELARLASRADKTQQNFAAGALTTRQVTIIIIAAAVIIIVIAVS
ncbi:MAG TPA: PA2779 family protein [Terriglobia bacterium]|nr:PA2779 family protein [Terriglobia bacterium]